MAKAPIPDKIPSNPLVCMRVSDDEKKEFQNAAKADGKKLGTWLRWLARIRVKEISRERLLQRLEEEQGREE